MKSLTVILPVFNEEENLDELVMRLDRVRQDISSFVSLRVLAVENGSKDDSLKILEGLCHEYPCLDLLVLHQNVGMDGALLAGINHAESDGVVTMQSDLEDPPETIAELVKPWLGGCDNVRSVNAATPKKSLRAFLRAVWYGLSAASSRSSSYRNASDFQLIDRSIYERMRNIRLDLVFFRNLPSELAACVCFVPYNRVARTAGKSKFKIRSGISFGLRAMTLQAMNVRPIVLLLSTLLGLATLIISSVAGLQVLVLGVPFDGYGLIVTMLFLGFLLQSVIGLTSISLTLRLMKALRSIEPYRIRFPEKIDNRLPNDEGT